MKNHVFIPAAVSVAILALTGAAHAQSDSNAGAQIASKGPGNNIPACAICHGAGGEGNASANSPRIAGQPKVYIARQLNNYANGSRKNPVMEPIAKGLTAEQIDAVAGYYAKLSTPPASTAGQGGKNAQAIKRGETLATVGDDKLGVQGCANCHGPGGAGEPPTYPYLGGQHAGYLSAALNEWKNGARNTDPSMQMSMIAKRLSDADIAALAAYYAAQPVSAPATQRTTTAAGTPQRSGAAPSTPQGATGTSQAVGTEQGEPTSGGSQGIGGGGATTGSGASGGGQAGPGSGKP